MIPPDAEQIIRAAAIADRAYTLMIRDAAEHPHFRLQLVDRRLVIDAELAGRAYRPPAPNLMEPIAIAVDRELEQLRPAVQYQIAHWRAMRRLSGCGYVQLSLSKAANMRRRIRKLVKDSGLTVEEFAEITGQSTAALYDHMGKGTIPKVKQSWYRSLRSLAVNRDSIVITLRRSKKA